MCDCCGEHTHELTLTINGLEGSAAEKLEGELFRITGLSSFDINAKEGTVSIEYNPVYTNIDTIIDSLIKAGFDVKK